jgi:electron transfer flavoprotein alpha subunit
METILVLTHVDESGSALTKGSLEAVAAGCDVAKRLQCGISIGVIGTDAGQAAELLASTGAKILVADGDRFAQARYASDAAACEALCRTARATVVLAPSSSRFARVLAGAAHRLGGAIDTHVTALGASDGIEVTRWFYRQRIEATLTRTSRPWFLLLDAGTYVAFAGAPGPVSVQRVSVELCAQRTNVTDMRTASKSANTIRPDARLLFVAGAGWTKKQPDGHTHTDEAGELILQFLEKADASLGSSKSLVDQGGESQQVLPFLTHMNQVGQTGSTPRHAKGLSTCCHGEEPHVVGWRFIGERRAISLDSNCGWTRGKADVVYIADAFQVMRKMNEILSK